MTSPKENKVAVASLQQEHKVAVATIDGKILASHFGSAPLFVVFTVKKGKILEEELRVNRGDCTRNADETQAGAWPSAATRSGSWTWISTDPASR
ncbi:MAG: hypothetical protein AB1384_05635 [Actinomycetota bacterium]